MAGAAQQSEKLNVFISYSRDDLAFAEQLYSALEAFGFGLAMDQRGISAGEDWQKRLGSLIRDADTVAFVLSPSSARSQMCAWEVGEAVQLGKRILPVLCRSLEDAKAPEKLASLNYIFFYAEPKSDGSGFGTGLALLVKALNTDLDWLREHTRYLQRATEWDTGGRSASRLLSGSDIASAKAWAARRPKDAPEPTPLQLDFVKASENEETRQQSAEAQRLQEMEQAQNARADALAEREKAQQQEAEARKNEAEAQKREATAARRVAQRTMAGLLAAIALTLVAGAFAWVSYEATQTANMQRALAVARQIATEARVTFEQDPESAIKLERSLLLATASLKFAWTQEGFESWSKAIELLPPTTSVLGPDDGPFRAVAFSRDGTRVAVAAKDSIIVMDSASLTEGTPPKILARLPQAGVITLAFKPTDGQILVGGNSSTAVVWTLSGSRQIRELPAQSVQFDSIAFDSQGERLAAAGMNYYARIFETEDWTEIGWVGNEAALAVAFSPDDRWLLTAGPRVVAWNMELAIRKPAGDPSAPAPPESFVVVGENNGSRNFVSFSSDGHWIAESGGLRAVIPSDTGPFRVADRLSFSSNPLVAISSDARLGATSGVTIRGLDLERQRFPQLGAVPAATVAFAPAGDWLVSVADDRVERWDINTGAEWRRLVHGAGLLDVAVSSDGRFLATTTVDGSAHVWETNSWREVFKAEIHRTEGEAASRVEFSADGHWLAATSQNVVEIFSTDDWRQVAAKDLENVIEGVAFSPDSKWLVAKDGPEFTLMAVKTWQTSNFAFEGADELSISPDGRRLLISRRPKCEPPRVGAHSLVRHEGLARIWEISSGQRQGEFSLTDDALQCSADEGENQDAKPLRAPDNAGWREWKPIPLRIEAPSALTSPDRAWVIKHKFSSDSIELRASNAADRSGITHRAGKVTNMGFSPDGKWLVTASDDGIARIWTFDRETMIAESCARVRRDLSPDDWRGILGGEPYSPVCPGLPPAH